MYEQIYSLRLYSNKIVIIQEREFLKKIEKQIEAAKENFAKAKFRQKQILMKKYQF